ncbi:hypothetical protein ACE6H2_016118 [Prunus campanulata]
MLIEPLKDRMDVPPKFVKCDIQDMQSSMCNIDVSNVCAEPTIGCLRYKSPSGEPQVGNESNVVEEVCGELATGCLTYKSPSGEPQVGNESNDVVEDSCHQVPTSLDCKTSDTEFQNKNVYTTSTIPEFDPSKMFQFTSTQDIILHGDSTGCGHEESPIIPKDPGPNLEGRQECLVNEGRNQELKLRLEEAHV